MKTQISRNGYSPEKRYSGVYQQQGSILTDRDWNEMVDVLKGRIDEGLAHAVGDGLARSGAVEILPGPQGPAIRPGTVYAGGVTAQVAPAAGAAVPFRYDQQADFPSPPALPAGQDYVLYADIWERPVLAMEDEGLRDRALTGAADPSTRSQTLAQIKWAPASADPEDPGQNPPRGNAILRVSVPSQHEEGPPPDTDAPPVAVDPLGRDVLLRLEVHDVTWPEEAPPEAWSRIVLKWSRENGARQYRYLEAPPWFKTGTWIYELYDPEAEKHLGYTFGSWIPVRGTLSSTFPEVSGEIAARSFVRRWDGYCVVSRTDYSNPHLPAFQFDVDPSTTAPGSVVTLSSWEEPNPDGDLAVKLGHLRLDLTLQSAVLLAGDSWQIPVRRAGYLPGSQILGDLPSGVAHRYVTLATVSAAGAVTPRPATFSPLAALQAGDVGYDGSGATNGLFNASHDTVKKALDRLWSLGAEHARYARPTNSGLYKDKTVANVKNALDLLSDVRARQIAYEGRTGVPDPQAALDALFGRSFKPNAWTTVGRSGQYPSVNAAITDLLAQQKRDIRLWLLPGDHELDPVQALIITNDPTTHLTFAGAGWASRLIVREAISISIQHFASVTFQELALEVAPKARILVGGGELVLLDNRISGVSEQGAIQSTYNTRLLLRDNIVEVSQVDPTVEPVSILAPLDTEEALRELFATRSPRLFALRANAIDQKVQALTAAQRQQRADAIQARLNQRPDLPKAAYNTFLMNLRGTSVGFLNGALSPIRVEALQRALPGTFLTIADAEGRVHLEGNQIFGTVSLYGPPGGDLTAAELQRLRDLVPSLSFDPAAGNDIVARNNRMTGFRVARTRIDRILAQNGTGQLYRRICLRDNTIDSTGNQLLAGVVSLHANLVLAAPTWGWTIAEEALIEHNLTRFAVTQSATAVDVVARTGVWELNGAYFNVRRQA